MDDVILSRTSVTRKPRTPAKLKLVAGVGLNDANHPVVVEGKLIKTYDVWKSMLNRCYSIKCQATKLSYIGCYVCPEWLRFSAFEQWMLQQDYGGKHLDKDLLYPGNKVYSPECCIFVSARINTILTEATSSRGALPMGVSVYACGTRYMSKCNTRGTQTYLGCFITPLLAHAAWQAARARAIDEAVAEDSDPRVKVALTRRADHLRDDLARGRITVSINL